MYHAKGYTSTLLYLFFTCYREPADVVANGDDDDDDDFSHGLHTFLRRVNLRRRRRHQLTESPTSDNVHIENRLIGAATFEKSYM